MAEEYQIQWLKVTIIIILTIYMYGAMSIKLVSGAESAIEAISFIFHDNSCYLYDYSSINPYYLGILLFAAASLCFSFGNIENAKMLQIITGILRVLAILCMYFGSIYYIVVDGPHMSKWWDFKNQISHIGTVFGNSVFFFIYHHSISGIIYPIRPQKQIKNMLVISHIAGFCFLTLEGVLAFVAFSSLDNPCTDALGNADYPCKI
eukprot:CAMPEP_0202958262 /NCGR_PEP_ID=MMETSP1396-20130829/2618_1 /ASSEMBLY_ACC=CAM_ASM_000872 /TAXON_ID= /ORGANISM="Pseudokeronopsis sp., Strain Brazil" /LENGTH=205 /DNA_ID=CAMNT_0049676235 /DNA_START=477 /DNA_END=1094 /DNA_ORIENTATION=+